MIDSTSIFALILVLTSLTAVVNGFKAVSLNVGGSIRQQSAVRLSASLKPQITKLIARQDLTTAETEVCGLHFKLVSIIVSTPLVRFHISSISLSLYFLSNR